MPSLRISLRVVVRGLAVPELRLERHLRRLLTRQLAGGTEVETPVERITEEAYRRTERRLYGYFHSRRRLERVEAVIRALEDQRNTLLARLAAGICLRPSYPSGSYSGMPTAPGPESPIERSLEYAEEARERMEERLIEIEERLSRLEIDRGRLLEAVAELDAVLGGLTDELRMIAQERFGMKLSYYQIGVALNMSPSAVRRRVQQLVLEVAKALGKAVPV